jgi:tripartite-type tricarboxylate transporter receptor subunit TctC
MRVILDLRNVLSGSHNAFWSRSITPGRFHLALFGKSSEPHCGAQTYPTRPVRMIVPFAPGSATDSIARIIAQKLSEIIGKQLYVENIGGAGGNIGVGRAAQAAPDGYTVLVVGNILVVNPALDDKVPYDPLKSFEPVALVGITNVLLTVNPSLPAQTVKDLVALIKATPGKYGYASGGGIGSPGHLVGEQFRAAARKIGARSRTAHRRASAALRLR